jgi:hypothetical protein
MGAGESVVRLASAVALLVALTGCSDNPAGPSVPEGEEFRLATGEIAAIEGAALVVRFDVVASDSRCPADALCVTQGDAEAVFTVTESGRGLASVTLHTEPGEAQRATIGDWTLTLTRLDPYPYSARPIAPRDYRVSLRADRNSGL